jgi:hypothetical protein
LLPDLPGSNQKSFHEEFIWAFLSFFFHHGEEVQAEVLENVKGAPTVLAKGAGEE